MVERGNAAPSTGTPPELTSFVGRREQLHELLGLSAEARLVTLVGPGGIGKTRLAVRLVHAMQRIDRATAVHWLTLSRSTDVAHAAEPTWVAHRLAESLPIQTDSTRPLRELLAAEFRTRVAESPSRHGGYLLVLDNCEHVADQVGALVSALLAAVRGLRVIVTSRELLGCAGEYTYQIPPLSYPAPTPVPSWPADPADYEAVDMLIERAKAIGVTIGDDERATAGTLCRRLDGIPLAIELAAAWLRTQSLAEIVARLDSGTPDSRFGMLTGGPQHGTTPLHHSLRGALDWSYELCSAPERLLWARLSVFEGGWDLAAAEAVASGAGVARTDVVGVLGALVDKSIVVAETEGPSTRYRLLETLRHYGYARAVELGEIEGLRQAHHAHFLSEARRAAQDWFSPREVTWLQWSRIELANLRAAVAWSATVVEAGLTPLELPLCLARLRMPFFLSIGAEAIGWLETGLARTQDQRPSETRRLAMALAGNLALSSGRVGAARRMLDACRAESTETHTAAMLFLEGLYAFYAEGAARSVRLLSAAVGEFDSAGSEFHGEKHMASFFRTLAAAWYATDDVRAAAQQVYDDAHAAGAEWATAMAMIGKGVAAISAGDPTEALELAPPVQRELVPHWAMMYASHLAAFAMTRMLCNRQGDDPRRDRADAVSLARVLGGAQQLRELHGMHVAGVAPIEQAYRLGEELASAILGEAAYAAALADGRNLTQDEFLDLAFHRTTRPEPADRSASPWDTLTGAEQEIAVLVAQGMTNTQIARRRICSVRTVEKHVENIRHKLFAAARADIAQWVPSPSTR
ncbi:LuxR C-terminal-related transcriptional regulator [Nocardia sp. NPDC049149]|uniref:helix-turn-helix transcriptional regulator n=1 Tax=Nocardia sp. NPDC049149 TaxID=3364315 RepID=UPI003717FECA